MATLRDLETAIADVPREALVAWVGTLAQSALVMELRGIDAKIATVRAEAARQAGEYQATVEELARMRSELQARIDSEMGR